MKGIGGLAGPSAAVRVGLRTFAQDDRVGERWRRAIQGFLRCPFGFAQGPVEMTAFVGASKERENTEVLRVAQNDGFGVGLGRAYPRG